MKEHDDRGHTAPAAAATICRLGVHRLSMFLSTALAPARLLRVFTITDCTPPPWPIFARTPLTRTKTRAHEDARLTVHFAQRSLFRLRTAYQQPQQESAVCGEYTPAGVLFRLARRPVPRPEGGGFVVVDVGEGARGAVGHLARSEPRLSSSRSSQRHSTTNRTRGSLADDDYHKSSAFGPRYWSPGQSK